MVGILGSIPAGGNFFNEYCFCFPQCKPSIPRLSTLFNYEKPRMDKQVYQKATKNIVQVKVKNLNFRNKKLKLLPKILLWVNIISM